MSGIFEREGRVLQSTAGWAPRALLVAAAVLVAVAGTTSLWDMTMFAPQYGDGLRLHIHSSRLEGGNRGQDLKEINLLNHYIGMHELSQESFTEFQWMPFMMGALALLFLRAAFFGTVGHLVDVAVLFLYCSLFSLWSFAHKLWAYGHELAPTAPVKVPGFMPPMFGRSQLANFEVYSYPGPGSYAFAAVALALAAALFLGLRGARTASVAHPRGASATGS
ncbi:hypothetical protein [Anaeromyxobacter diazotrophicus]|uniref:Uncharacterized protein n=1 Tax=Anaeromyxobacter diazotrophicus TaxID=2590199 RepID=A0A7I9VKS6_9BACT|nr:hypothetical protein [Anaeromyxobacter diazotrophicus]GEJ57013.1 hypothetical protein AMYX_17540 [Anaeromyxobacter diazotrophicus]